MSENGVEDLQLNAVLDGIHEMLRLARVDHLVKVVPPVPQRKSLTAETVVPHETADFYVRQGRERSSRKEQANATVILDALLELPQGTVLLSRPNHPHYHVLVLRTDIYQDEITFVVGLAYPEWGMVLSVSRFSGLDSEKQAGCIQTATMHEIAHVFMVPAPGRKENIKDSLGRHCTNDGCLMRQGLCVPKDWLSMTRDRLRTGAPLCSDCLCDLRRYFSE